MSQSDPTASAKRTEPFYIKDCALIALATGKKARLLQEFRNELADIDTASIYHHLWGGLQQPRFEEREYLTLMVTLLHGAQDRIELG
jgi:hypothetical protein